MGDIKFPNQLRTKTMKDSIKQNFSKAERKAFTKAKRAVEAAIKAERQAEQKAYRASITKPAPRKAKAPTINFKMAKSFIPKNIKVQAITIIKK